MTGRFSLLNRRQQALVVAGLGLLLLLLGHLLIVKPLLTRLTAYQREIPAQRELLAWMEASAREVERIQAARTARPKARGSAAPLTVIDQRAKELKLEKRIKRIEPTAEGEVRVWLDEAGFAAMVTWLSLLEEEEGLAVTDLTVDRAKGEGLVNAALTLTPDRP